MKGILKLLRVKHYIKNVLIFLPLFFAGQIFSPKRIVECTYGFIAFSLTASAVYILNDIKDVDKDRKHPTKRMRPIASGKISKGKAGILFAGCILVAILISVCRRQVMGLLILGIYLIVNIMYSCGLKNIPIIDVVILASGFVLRIVYGGIIADIEISQWLYLVVMAGSLFMGLGKRRNELVCQKETRTVLKYYSKAFLDKNMYVCVAMVDIFYAMWSMETKIIGGVWTVPLLIVIMMKYSMDIEGESDGDPIEVILRDKVLISLVIVYALVICILLYVF